MLSISYHRKSITTQFRITCADVRSGYVYYMLHLHGREELAGIPSYVSEINIRQVFCCSCFTYTNVAHYFIIIACKSTITVNWITCTNVKSFCAIVHVQTGTHLLKSK